MPHAVWSMVALGVALSLIGCGPAVRSTPFETFPPHPADHPIGIYSTKTPECPYEEVGLVSARRRYALVMSMSDVLEALKERARAMGGDAVMGVSEGAEVSGDGEDVTSTPVLSGTVIRFTEEECTR